MNGESKLEVVDQEGWRKEYSLQKPLTHIGSDPKNDVILETERGGGVSSLHAQLIALTNGHGYRLVNLSNADIPLGSGGEQSLPPRSTLELSDGQIFRLGDFMLVFRGVTAAPEQSGSGGRQIGLSLALPSTRLAPQQSLKGVVTVRNLGERSGAKFDVELEGMEPDCYEIEPGPLLSSGAEKEISLLLYHWGAKPLAGERRLTIRAVAPNAYPAEQATVSQVIQILPYYQHKMQLIPPAAKKVKTAAQPATAAEPPIEQRRKRPAEIEPPPVTEDWWAADAAPEPRLRAKVTKVVEVEASAPAPSAAAPATVQLHAAEVQTVEVKASPPAQVELPQAEPGRAVPTAAPPPGQREAGPPASEPAPAVIPAVRAEPAPPPVEIKTEPEQPARARRQRAAKIKVDQPELPDELPNPAFAAAQPGETKAPAAEKVDPMPEVAGPEESHNLPAARAEVESFPPLEPEPQPEQELAPDIARSVEPMAQSEPVAHPAPAAGRLEVKQPPALKADEPSIPAGFEADDDWAADKDEPQPPARLKISAGSAGAEKERPKAASPEQAEDWWTSEGQSPAQRNGERRVIKLKATAGPEAEEAPSSAAGDSAPAQSEDWWSETEPS